MTALIIGLLAAIGIGGGVAIANNSGGHSGGNSAIVEPVNPAANLNPNYELISALTGEEYNITAATEGSLLKNYYDEGGAGPVESGNRGAEERHNNTRVSSLLDGYNPSNVYRLNGGDLIEDGQLTEDITTYSGEDITIKLNLRAGVDKIGITTWKADEGGGSEENSFYLTSANVGTHHTSEHYNSFEHEDDPVLLPNGNTLHHYTAVHLGGSKLGLSTADFGRWEETSWQTDSLGNIIGEEDVRYQTFMLYDDTYSYQGVYTGPNALDNIPLQGWAIADVARNYDGSPRDNNLYTGTIYFNLNLANNTLTGNVAMPDLPSNYSFNFVGDIIGSIIRIDGTGWQGEWPEEGVSRGGMGKLLVGKDGLEIVGNMGPQIYNPTDEYIQHQMQEWGVETLDSEQLRSLFEQGKVDYTFGAKEVINQ